MLRWNSNNPPWHCLLFMRSEWWGRVKSLQKTLAESLREWSCCMTWLQLPQHVSCWVWYMLLTWLIQILCTSHLKSSKKFSCNLSSTRCLPKFRVCLEDFSVCIVSADVVCQRTDLFLIEQKSSMSRTLNKDLNWTSWSSFGHCAPYAQSKMYNKFLAGYRDFIGWWQVSCICSTYVCRLTICDQHKHSDVTWFNWKNYYR